MTTPAPTALAVQPSGLRPVWAGVALVLAGSPVGAVVQGTAWWGYAAAGVALVVAVGVATRPRRTRPGAAVLTAGAQLAALAVLVTTLFTGSGVLGVLPGPAATRELAALVGSAAAEIRGEVAPVPATPAMLLLVTVAFGVTAVAVHAITVGAGAPAAAGVLLLAVFAVPAALADDLLPAWILAAATAGFGLLLLARPGPPADRRPWQQWREWRVGASAVAVVAAAVALALGAGAVAEGVGTAGRFPSTGGTGAGRVGEIGLSPFTALRGELRQSTPAELFRVSGLPRPTYLRALTLSSYVPDNGWQVRRPGPGTPLTGELPGADVPGDRASVRLENLGFRDYWLPVYGVPLAVSGPAADRWSFDPVSGTAYSTRPQLEPGWTQEALLAAPTAEALRTRDGETSGVDPAYLSTDGVDPRVAAMAREVTGDASTGFDRAVALTRWFTGPGSPFTYDLATAPGNGDDALVEFLTVGRRGYCEQFASAMAVMLRTLGVPARVAVGFTGGRVADGGARTVSTADAHAWVEAWFPATGWTTFDPTPLTDGRAIVPPYVAQAADETDDRPSAAPAPPDTAEAAPADPVPDSAAPESDVTATDPAPEETAADGSVRPVAVGLLAVLVVAGAMAAPATWRARLRRTRLAAVDAGGAAAADAAWAELLAESADRGDPEVATDTVRTAAERMMRAHGLDARTRRPLDTVVEIVEESWYGGVHPAPGVLSGPVRDVSAALRCVPVAPHRRLFPASVTTRGTRGTSPHNVDGSDDAAVVRIR